MLAVAWICRVTFLHTGNGRVRFVFGGVFAATPQVNRVRGVAAGQEPGPGVQVMCARCACASLMSRGSRFAILRGFGYRACQP